MIEALAGFEDRFSEDQNDYFEILSDLVIAYDEQHEPKLPRASGLEVLRYLLECNELNAADLSRMLGVERSMGPKILRGERSLTLQHIEKLATRFNVGVDAFVGSGCEK